jgi:hypothetical protein
MTFRNLLDTNLFTQMSSDLLKTSSRDRLGSGLFMDKKKSNPKQNSLLQPGTIYNPLRNDSQEISRAFFQDV